MKRILLAILSVLLVTESARAVDSVNADDTSIIVEIFVSDSSVTTGAGLTGLVFDTAGLSCYYSRNGVTGSAVQISLVTMTKGTWTSGGFVAVDGTNMPGWYQLGVPNAAFASGARGVIIQCKGAANMAPANIHVPIFTVPNVNVVSIANNAITAASIATDAAAEIGASAARKW